MAYDAAEVGSLRFLAGNLMFQLTKTVISDSNDECDLDALDDGTLMMDVITSYYTEQDDTFQKEWKVIQDARAAAAERGFNPTVHRDKAVEFRLRELKAMFRSLCRKGVFVYQEPEESEWDIKT